MKLKILIAILFTGASAYFVFSAVRNKAFAPAADFPRGALVYVQTDDLPALIRLWNESKVKEKYLTSGNYAGFKNRHLALKLAGRWQEFSNAAGFPLDLQALGGLADKRAAVALYDIGRLEFVFVAPVSEEIFAATKFVQNKEKFVEEDSGDGTRVYRASVEADRGRQKQELLFANVKGRFILATSEKLLARTLSNIGEKSGKDRLSDEPNFKILTEKIESNPAVVWVDQAALNEDYYFKRYWLMSGAEDLRNIRAGIFDFAAEDGKLIERRRFLLSREINSPRIEPAQAAKMLARLPAGIPFYRLRTTSEQTLNDAIQKTIFDRRDETEKSRQKSRGYYSDYDYDDYERRDYSSLGEKFDENIDEIEDEEISVRTAGIDFATLLRAANPQAALIFTRPDVRPAPLFVEFRRGAVINLGAPDNFDRNAFEKALERAVAAQILIASPGASLQWETETVNDFTRRELKLPALGWSIGYTIRGDELILANDADFLTEILAARNEPQTGGKPDSPLAELTVLRLAEKENSFDKVFAQLERKKAADEFFTVAVGSFLDSVSEVEKIEVKRNYTRNMLDEQITFYLRQSD